jgi:hypothetical protein
VRAGVPGRNISGKRFVTDRRINECRGRGDNCGQTERAGGATLFVLIRLRRVAIAFVTGRFCLHLCATVGLLNFHTERLAGNRGESERRGKRQTEQESKSFSHAEAVYHAVGDLFNPALANARLSAASKMKRIPGAMPEPGASDSPSKPFATVCQNPYPVVEPVVRETKFC